MLQCFSSALAYACVRINAARVTVDACLIFSDRTRDCMKPISVLGPERARMLAFAVNARP